jgi:outer membrane protein OmpA-like peptidoglycan-associated protein
MNAFKFTGSLALAVVLSLAATGCKHKQPPITRFPPNGGLNGGNGDNLGDSGKLGGTLTPDATGSIATSDFNPDNFNQDRSAFAADTVYFDYDSATIKGSEQSKLTGIVSALQSDASAKLLVEGYCDERGTEEYNRSLGERRALAAREALASAGLGADRVATRSYGEDRAADPGHTPGAWAKNRRDEFVLLHPK